MLRTSLGSVFALQESQCSHLLLLCREVGLTSSSHGKWGSPGPCGSQRDVCCAHIRIILSPSPPAQKRCGNRRALVHLYCTNSIAGSMAVSSGCSSAAVTLGDIQHPRRSHSHHGVSKGPLLCPPDLSDPSTREGSVRHEAHWSRGAEQGTLRYKMVFMDVTDGMSLLRGG